MRFSKWIISNTGGQTMVYLFYTTLFSIEFAQYEIFCAIVCDFWQGWYKQMLHNIGIKHGFPCINVCQVRREMSKTEAVGRGFQHLPRDLANVNVLENNV